MYRIKSKNHKNTLRCYVKHPATRRLLDYCHLHGFKVLFFDNLDCPDTYGSFSAPDKEIVVTAEKFKGRARSFEEFLFILAHEARHLEHFVNGLYRSYYDERRLDRLASGLATAQGRSLGSVCNLLVGLRAERDCDDYASSYVKQHLGKRANFSRAFLKPYPVSDVAIYDDYRAAMSDNMRGVSDQFEAWLAKQRLLERDVDAWMAQKKTKTNKTKRKAFGIDYRLRGLRTRMNRLIREARAIKLKCGPMSAVAPALGEQLSSLKAVKSVLR